MTSMIHFKKHMKRLALSFVVVFFIFSTMEMTVVRAADVTPPDITNVQVNSVGDSSFTITWTTDENADSLINYGLKEDYGIIRIPGTDKVSHSITLDRLDPGQVYHFRVVSSDDDGNQGISADYKVQTTGTKQSGGGEGSSSENNNEENQTLQTESSSQTDSSSQSQSQSDNETAQEVIDRIQQIQSPDVLKEILDQVIKAIQGITDDLTIVGPPTVVAETVTARVMWITDREASSVVFFSSADSYVDGQYQFSQASTGSNKKDHEVQLIGLEPFTEYHFKVQSKDSVGSTGESRDYTFRTKASRPDIKNLRILKVEENSATLAWDTVVPSKALIEYQDLTTGAQNSVGRPTLASTHQMKISDLTLGTRYVAFVIAENAGGDRVKSNPLTFITVKDTEPPLISNVTNESTLFPGSGSRVQTIVEWNTDEPSFCTMSYREGISGGIDPTIIESETINYTEEHVEVIVEFAPATVYQFWLNCTDDAKNTVQSENFVLFTPIQEKSIIDLILENFESTFGWLKNING